MNRGTVLVVDDDVTFSRVLMHELSELGYRTLQGYGTKVAEVARKENVDVVLLDLVMPDVDGLQVLRALRELREPPEVLMLTGHATIDTAVMAIKYGASEYLPKPVETQQLAGAIDECVHRRRAPVSPTTPRPLITKRGVERLIGFSPAIQRVRSFVSRYGPSDSTVLIQGESGTGKDLVAQLIHLSSPRCARPFMVVDCTALAEELLASELFGHERGAFTGAVAARQGIFELADKGTVFLDEIGDLAPGLQAKLLRVVDTKSFRRVGGRKHIEVDVRIVAATNRDLATLVKRNVFRKDLYYRLAVVKLELPPLRDHLEDIPTLVNHICSQRAEGSDSTTRFSVAALNRMARYDWPGNVRELHNMVELMILQHPGGCVEARDIELDMSLKQDGTLPTQDTSPRSLHDLEHAYVLQVVRSMGGNKSAAARALGIDRKTLSRKLRNG